jgi:hypothetical protein
MFDGSRDLTTVNLSAHQRRIISSRRKHALKLAQVQLTCQCQL